MKSSTLQNPLNAKEKLESLLREVRACRVCENHLPLGPNPVLRVSSTARILIASQAPGVKVHETSLPFNDASGDRLREWMSVSREVFYDASRISIIPMGYCYPGKGPGGDLPPRRECAELWLPRLLENMPRVRLTLLVGIYSQKHYLGARAKSSLTETVRRRKDYAPEFLPLPHPSPRNFIWMMRNPWFEREVVPDLRAAVHEILGGK